MYTRGPTVRVPVLTSIRALLQRGRAFLVHRVLGLDDTPHRIALGVAIAIWLTWTPTIGLQTVATMALCGLFGANKVVGLPFVWISNPATIVPIYYPSYRLGCWLLRRAPDEGLEALAAAAAVTDGVLERIYAWYAAIAPMFAELWIGSIAIASPLALGTYLVVRRAVVSYRQRYHDWKERRRELRDHGLHDR